MVTWTKVSFAEALPLRKLVSGLTIAGQTGIVRTRTLPGRPRHWPTDTSQSQNPLWSAGSEESNRLGHFWYFNTEMVASVITARVKPQISRPEFDFPIHPPHTSILAPRSPSTTELILVKAVKPAQTLWNQGPGPSCRYALAQ